MLGCRRIQTALDVARAKPESSGEEGTMYESFSPPRIYVCNDILTDPDAQTRADRILAAYPDSEIVPFDREGVGDLILRHGLGDKRPRMGIRDVGPPSLFLTLAQFTGPDENNEEVQAILARNPAVDRRMVLFLLGLYPWHGVWLGGLKHEGRITMGGDMVCRPAWRLNTMLGCPHHCVYCAFGELIPMYVNMGAYCERLVNLMAANPWQQTYLYDDAAEALFPEPALGAIEGMIECCKQFPDRHLVIHTKSANVDFLRDLDHQGRCTMTWSLTSSLQSREAEPFSATMEERVEAARKCASWGYPVRIKFKPIVPFAGWREHAREMIRQILSVKLDNISLFTIAWMDVDDLKTCFPVELLDQGFLKAAEDAKEEMKTRSVKPYPHHVRAEIYRFYIQEIRAINPDVPITLCTEAPDMWEELAPLVGQKPRDFVCGCGPMTSPGLGCLRADPWRDVKPVSVWD